MLTMGVEEEFFLLDQDGALAPKSGDVTRLAAAGREVTTEYMAYQVETATPVCTRLDELRSELLRLRLVTAGAAEQAGVRLVAAGAAPSTGGPLGAHTDHDRYRKRAHRYPDATAIGGTCACQVHVGIPDRELAVDVVTRLRPWLPTLLALTTNSPFAGRVDSGWCSTRYRSQRRWPTFRPPAGWINATRYDEDVRRLIARGAAMDPASIYFLARLSARYPTVEVRVADACLTVEDAVLHAAVVRALVMSLVEDARRGRPVPATPQDRISTGLLAAARHGMSGPAAGLHTAPKSIARALVTRLLQKITPALAETGDLDEVRNGLDRLCRDGTGADRQRALRAGSATVEQFVAALAERTVPRTESVPADRSPRVPADVGVANDRCAPW